MLGADRDSMSPGPLTTGTSRDDSFFRCATALRDVTLAGKRDCALGVCCPAADACWGERQDPHVRTGRSSPPWIGADYRPGGVCVVGLNLRIGAGRGTHWEIERKIAGDQYRALAAGRSRSTGSRWASSTMRDAALVLRGIALRSLHEPPDGAELARTLERTARGRRLQRRRSTRATGWRLRGRAARACRRRGRVVRRFRIGRSASSGGARHAASGQRW
jgi:hypothetical protein